MRNPILIGQAQSFYRMIVGDVWCDKKGKIGVIVAETSEAFMLQTAEHIIELVPKAAQTLFESTCEHLGPLDFEEGCEK